MFPFASPLRRSPQLRRSFALVLARAEDQIVQANVEEAVEFLKETERQLTFENALDIYFRLVGLPNRLRHAVTIHALSRLGDADEVDELDDDAPGKEPGAVRALARRLRGRKREELRHEIEEATHHARARVRGAYLEGATRAVDALRDVVEPREALRYFIEALEIGPEWAELIAHEVIGVGWADPPSARADTRDEEDATVSPQLLPSPAPSETAQLPLTPDPTPDQPPAPEA